MLDFIFKNPKRVLWIKQMIKFGIVGLLNTGICAGVIVLLMKVFSVNYVAANVVGYIFGVTNSLIMNKLWTFKSKGSLKSELPLFVLMFGICYVLQLGLVVLLKEIFGIDAYVSQFAGMVFYTGLNFITNKMITFKKGTDHAES